MPKTHLQNDLHETRTQCGVRIKEDIELSNSPSCKKCVKSIQAFWKDKN